MTDKRSQVLWAISMADLGECDIPRRHKEGEIHEIGAKVKVLRSHICCTPYVLGPDGQCRPAEPEEAAEVEVCNETNYTHVMLSKDPDLERLCSDAQAIGRALLEAASQGMGEAE